MSAYFQAIAYSLLAPALALLEPSRRVYWPFLLSSLLLAAFVYLRDKERRFPSLVAYLFPKAVWWHRSARLDYQLLFAKAVITAALITPLAFSAVGVAALIATLLRLGFGEMSGPSLSSTQLTLAFTVVTFLGDDLSRYVLHRLLHRVPRLWELHKVHHSAEVLTPFTLYRSHPIETLLYRLRGALTQGVIIGCFYALYGSRISGYDVLGVNVFGFLFSAAGANLRHSHVWMSWHPLEWLFISPAQHQVHHSIAKEHNDRNFGAALALWDWIGKTLYMTRRQETLRLGLTPEEINHAVSLPSALYHPLRAAFRRGTPKNRVHE